MARNQGYKQPKGGIPEGYELARDADGNIVLVRSTPDEGPRPSPFSRISEGAMEGYGYNPLQGVSEQDRANYPRLSAVLDPVAKGLDAVRRFPGAVAGGLAGTAGAGTELWTGDRGAANRAERGARSALEYFGNQGMATMGGPRPSAHHAPLKGEVLPPERGGPRQLGYTERPPVDVYRELPPGVIRAGSAEGLPRLTYEEPLSRYGKAVDYTYGVGPKRQFPRSAMDIHDQMYTLPEELNTRPVVNTPPDPLRVLGDESPRQAERQGNLATAARDSEARFKENQLAAAENEGYGRPMTQADKDFAQFVRDLEGGVPFEPPVSTGSTRSPLLDKPAPGVKRRAPPPPPPRTEPKFDFGGPQSVTGGLVDPLTGRAYTPLRFGESAPRPASGSLVNPLTGEAMPANAPVDLNRFSNERPAPAQGSTPSAPADPVAAARQALIDQAAERVAAERRAASDAGATESLIGRDAARIAAERAGTQPIAPAMPNWAGRNLPYLATGAAGAAGYGLISASEDARRRMEPVDRLPSGYAPQSFEDFQRMFPASSGELATSRPQIPAADADSITAGYDVIPAKRRQIPAADADSITAGYDSPSQRARTTAGSVLSGSRAGSSSQPSESGGLLSGLFGSGGKFYDSDYQKGASQKELWQAFNEDPENKAAFFRAAKGDTGPAPTGENRGGAVNNKPTKEAALHKALEIIHHMVKGH